MANAHVVKVSNGDDWEGLYINGRRVIEFHQVTVSDACEALKGYHVVSYDQLWVTPEYTEELMGLPENLGEIPMGVRQ